MMELIRQHLLEEADSFFDNVTTLCFSEIESSSSGSDLKSPVAQDDLQIIKKSESVKGEVEYSAVRQYKGVRRRPWGKRMLARDSRMLDLPEDWSPMTTMVGSWMPSCMILMGPNPVIVGGNNGGVVTGFILFFFLLLLLLEVVFGDFEEFHPPLLL
ncbi:hypothetical protein SASPL_117866 [Salvia splendens]|uniref:Uncharacterized protein n=1 Tax=Salvia splendens TaxID=180675 RepID=A0A8X8XWM0_SALSN|nr:hypothetical protein SASPL_117866 [Salvia splendens]